MVTAKRGLDQFFHTESGFFIPGAPEIDCSLKAPQPVSNQPDLVLDFRGVVTVKQNLLCKVSPLCEGLLPLVGSVVAFVVLIGFLGLFGVATREKIAASRPGNVTACPRRGRAFIGVLPRPR